MMLTFLILLCIELYLLFYGPTAFYKSGIKVLKSAESVVGLATELVVVFIRVPVAPPSGDDETGGQPPPSESLERQIHV